MGLELFQGRVELRVAFSVGLRPPWIGFRLVARFASRPLHGIQHITTRAQKGNTDQLRLACGVHHFIPKAHSQLLRLTKKHIKQNNTFRILVDFDVTWASRGIAELGGALCYSLV